MEGNDFIGKYSTIQDDKSLKRLELIQQIIAICIPSIIIFLENQLTTFLVGFFPIYASNVLNANALHISILFSIYPIGIMLSSFISSSLCNYIGIQTVTSAGLFLSGGFTLLFGYNTSIPCLIIFRLCQGIGAGAAVVGAASMMVQTFPKQIEKVIGAEELIVAMAFITAPPIGSYIYDFGGYQMPFLVSGLSQLFLVVITALLCYSYGVSDGIYICSATYKRQSSMFLRSIPNTLPSVAIVLNRITIVSLLVTLVSMSSFGFIDPTLGSHLQRVLGIQHTYVGFGFGLSALVYFLVTWISGWLHKKCECRFLILLGLFQLAIGFILLGPSPILSPYLNSKAQVWNSQLISLLLIGCGAAISIAPGLHLSSAHIQQHGNIASQYLIGLFSTFIYLGQAIGPLVAYGLMDILPETWSRNCMYLHGNDKQACITSMPWACTVYACMILCVIIGIGWILPSNDQMSTTNLPTVRLQRQHGNYYGQFVRLDSTDEEYYSSSEDESNPSLAEQTTLL